MHEIQDLYICTEKMPKHREICGRSAANRPLCFHKDMALFITVICDGKNREVSRLYRISWFAGEVGCLVGRGQLRWDQFSSAADLSHLQVWCCAPTFLTNSWFGRLFPNQYQVRHLQHNNTFQEISCQSEVAEYLDLSNYENEARFPRFKMMVTRILEALRLRLRLCG